MVRGVPEPVLVPVRASPVPSVVRGSFLMKFFRCVSASARQSRAQCRAREFCRYEMCRACVL